MKRVAGGMIAIMLAAGFIRPPERYECTRGDVLVSVRPRAQVEEVCSRAGAGDQRAACTLFYDDPAKPTRIVIPPRGELNVTVEDYGELFVHELAHACGGWPPNHPDSD